MLHVVENAIAFRPHFRSAVVSSPASVDFDRVDVDTQDYGLGDIDIVDDSLLNTAPHNKIERQLLNGDVVGLALMSGAILWSAMGAFG